jgi:hypothetical protein
MRRDREERWRGRWRFKREAGLEHNVNNAAVVVLDARKGEILAWWAAAIILTRRFRGR